MNGKIRAILADEADGLLQHECRTVSREMLHLPGPTFILTRYQVVNCYMGRIPLINSGGASGRDDLQQAVRTAVINKRAGGAGLITGRKAFQKPMNEGVELLHAVQDVYLDSDIILA